MTDSDVSDVGNCIKCGAVIQRTHPWARCGRCGARLPAGVIAALPALNPGLARVRQSADGAGASPPVKLAPIVHVPSAASSVVTWGIAGLVAGVAVGLLTRPSIPLVGQLPIDVVLTRGANLTGMDQLLKSAAEQSFNQVLVVGIIGAIVAALIGAYLAHQKRAAAVAAPASALSAPAAPAPIKLSDASSQPANSLAAFCIACGGKLPDVAAFCPKCGTERAGSGGSKPVSL
jgi:small basic protein